MLEAVYIWVSMALIFLVASIWGESDMKFGVVLVPLFTGIFWLFGWLPEQFVEGALMFALTLGIISFLKEQYKQKLGAGTLGGFTIWKVMAFIVFIQFATVFVCGMTYSLGDVGSKQIQPMNTTQTDSYNIVTADTVYGQATNIDEIDAVTTGLTMGWMAYNTLWGMWWGVITVYPTLVNVFHIPPPVALVVSGGIYVMLAVEVITLIWFRTRPPTV